MIWLTCEALFRQTMALRNATYSGILPMLYIWVLFPEYFAFREFVEAMNPHKFFK